ncbi:MAG: dockerin type I domain-containing protein [Verrucomicrobiales bacterium]|nr:dockerin type I domain-containing protein [Verrucomicrobiales bacterium]
MQDNGGFTSTHALLGGSPALNRIPGAPGTDFPTTDQRGVARPQDALADIGAFELLLLPGDLNRDGCVDRDDLTLLLAKIRARSTDLAYDVNGDGRVNIADARKLALLFSNPNGVPCMRVE